MFLQMNVSSSETSTNVPFTFNITENNAYSLLATGEANNTKVIILQDVLPSQGWHEVSIGDLHFAGSTNFLRVVNLSPNPITVFLDNQVFSSSIPQFGSSKLSSIC